MKYYGTKNNKDYGFYLENFDNAIEISENYWEELLQKQSEGKIIIPFEDKVIAVKEEEYSLENGKWKKLSEEEISFKQKEVANLKRKNEIEKALDELDKKRIRAIAEPSMKDSEISWLEYYNQQTRKLREELDLLNK